MLPHRDFGYFLSQRGMFSYTGLTPAQVDVLREQHAVYLVRSGPHVRRRAEQQERRAHRGRHGGGAARRGLTGRSGA